MERLGATFIGVIFLLGLSLGALSATLTVPDDYPTIQAAIDVAEPGDTVYVKAGRYKENLTIDKPLHLVGEGHTEVIVQSPNVEQDVVTVRMVKGETWIEEIYVHGGYRGIYYEGSGELTISRCIIAENERWGVVASGQRCRIENCFLWGNPTGGVAAISLSGSLEIVGCEIVGFGPGGGVGVHLQTGGKVEISGCVIGLVARGVEVHSAACGWDDISSVRMLRMQGQDNRVHGGKRSICPGYPGDPWPKEFLNLDWTRAITQAMKHIGKAETEFTFHNPIKALAECKAGLAALRNSPFPVLQAHLEQDYGAACAYLGRTKESLASYERALRIYQARGREVEVAHIYGNIGMGYSGLGRYEEALRSCLRARTTYETREMEVNVAKMNWKIGEVYQYLGHYEEALEQFRRAREVFKTYKNVMFYEVMAKDCLAGVECSIGSIYLQMGQYEQALEYFSRARGEFGGGTLRAAMADQDIAAVYTWLGRYEEALERLGWAQVQYEIQGMDKHLARLEVNRGLIFWLVGQYSDALECYRRALAISNKFPPATGMVYSFPEVRWKALFNKGLCYETFEKWDEARSAYEEAIAVIESMRSYFQSEEFKVAWQQHTKGVYERLIKLLIDHGQGTDAFPYAERCRARTFLDLLAKGPVGTIENVAEAGIKTGVVDAEAIERDVQEVVHSLPADTAVLEYFVTDTATYVWVIYQGKIQGPIQLDHGRAELMDKVIDTREQLGSSPQQPFNPRNLVELYDWLIRPVENLLPETSSGDDVPHLIIIPSGPLYYLPFQALIWTGEDLSENAPLIARYALSYSPSLATLKYAQALTETAYPQATFLALADPDSGDPRLPDAQTEARMVAQLFPHATVYVDSDATEDVVQSDSATAREILLSTHGLFNPHNPMYSYLVVSPTVRNSDGRLYAHEVFTLPLHANMVVLSACETLLPSLDEMEEQVGKVARRAGDDTPVKLTNDQLEELTAGDEVVGLTRAFISAGASSVLSSLWSVPSGSTSQLMISFYNHIAEGMDKAHALRAAQLEVMNAIGCTQPWYWAAFNLMGDWQQRGATAPPDTGKLEYELYQRLEEWKSTEHAPDESPPVIPVLLTLFRPATQEDLEAFKGISEEIEVQGAFGHFVQLRVPLPLLEVVGALPQVRSVTPPAETILD